MKTEQEKIGEFEEAVGGVKRAEHLQRIWNNSSPVGNDTPYDIKMGTFHSREKVFTIKAKREGYTEKQINMFLALP